MNYRIIFLLLYFTVGLNASLANFPTLSTLTDRCLKTNPLNKMDGLKEFLIEKNKAHFEEFCRKNNIIAHWTGNQHG